MTSITAATPIREQVAVVGFAIVPDVFPPEEMNRTLEALSGVVDSRSRAGARHALRYEPVRALADDKRLLSIAREILGADPIPFRATLFDKSPDANWLVIWHQDTALPLRSRADVPGWGPWSVKYGINYAHAPATALEQVIALRIHLDDSTSANGPLRLLRKTHRFGVLRDEQVQQIAAQTEAVECAVPRGGVIAMRPLIIHASSKSQSDIPRRVLHIEYGSSLSIAPELELAIA